MSHQIIKQPDGRWAVWSTVVDELIITDATVQELQDYYAWEASKDAVERTRKIIYQIESGKRPYHQFTMSYAEALALQADRGQAIDPPEPLVLAPKRDVCGPLPVDSIYAVKPSVAAPERGCPE